MGGGGKDDREKKDGGAMRERDLEREDRKSEMVSVPY